MYCMSKPLEFTGERFTPECVREIWYEHIHRYAFAGELVRGKRVLDAACGEGYGAAQLVCTAQSVKAVDISDEAISHAQRRYRAENLEFRVADCCKLPFPDDEFECIVSFETLEHLEDQAGLLKEFRRVLAPDGFLLANFNLEITHKRCVFGLKVKNILNTKYRSYTNLLRYFADEQGTNVVLSARLLL